MTAVYDVTGTWRDVRESSRAAAAADDGVSDSCMIAVGGGGRHHVGRTSNQLAVSSQKHVSRSVAIRRFVRFRVLA